MSKMQPFWWFLAPELLTFWEDKCESLPNSWEWTPPYNSVTLSSPAKEGSFCFKIRGPYWGVTTQALKTISPSIALPSVFNLRFWLKVVSVPSVQVYDLGLTAGTIGLKVYDVGDGLNLYVRLRNQSYDSAALYSMTKSAWHLIRLEVEQDGSYVRDKLYIDGVYKGIMSRAWTFGDLNNFRFSDTTGSYEVYVDWFRVTNF